MLNLYRRDKTDTNCKTMVRARSVYNTCIHNCRFEYDKQTTGELLEARF